LERYGAAPQADGGAAAALPDRTVELSLKCRKINILNGACPRLIERAKIRCATGLSIRMPSFGCQ
jgi:hypothetical protein